MLNEGGANGEHSRPGLEAQLPGRLWQPWRHLLHPECHSGGQHCLLTQSWAGYQWPLLQECMTVRYRVTCLAMLPLNQDMNDPVSWRPGSMQGLGQASGLALHVPGIDY